jgi:hypothetical protein
MTVMERFSKTGDACGGRAQGAQFGQLSTPAAHAHRVSQCDGSGFVPIGTISRVLGFKIRDLKFGNL